MKCLHERTSILLRIAVFSLTAGITLWAQTRAVRLGDVGLPLHVGEIVQGDAEALKPGRAKVVEFWAASCPWCVANIPHLNALAHDFQTRPIDFLNINVSENPDALKSFILRHPMVGLVAADAIDASSAAAYGLEAIPVTALLAKNGRVAAIGNPSQVTAKVLEDLLAGRPIALPAGDAPTMALPKHHIFLEQSMPDDGALVKAIVTPTANNGTLVSAASQVESTGTGLRQILSYAFDVPPLHVVLPDLLAEENFAIQAWVPEDSPELLKPLIQNAILASAAIRVRKEKSQRDVWVVEGLPGRLTSAPASATLQSTCQRGQIEGDAMSPELLTRCFEQILGAEVLFKDGLSGRFRFVLSWNVDEPHGFERALKEQLGLTLKAAKHEVDLLVVEPFKSMHAQGNLDNE